MMAKVLFKFGTAAQYAALETKQENALYFLLDTNELYRGTVPIAKQHVYVGNRSGNTSDVITIATLLNGNSAVNGDIVVIKNANQTSDAFVYAESTQEWLRVGSSTSDTIISQLTGRVSDLEALLNGVEADPSHNIEAEEGLIDRVANLESLLASTAGAFHFKGTKATIADLEATQNPGEGDVYQVGTSEYVWTGSAWIELGPTVDLSSYATTSALNTAIADLEALIGEPSSTTTETDPITGEETTTTTPATGIYADLFEHADQIIPLFDGVVSGLVPVDGSNDSANVKANKFLNALGNWVTVNTTGSGPYTDPDGHTYNTVEAYVTYMVNTYGAESVWESIDGN